MYRPNFCLDCGERIHRRRWYPWTNRRFCPKCATRLRRATVFVPAAGVCVLIVAAWLFGRSASPEPPPLIIEQATLPAAAMSTISDSSAAIAPDGNAPNAPTQLAAARSTSLDAQAEPPTDPYEIVSICGARTKKGTPCSRRVRGTGRCWQHRGKGAILAPGKLIVR